MSIVIALVIVAVVAGLIAKYYPKQQPTTLAQGEILIPEPESIVLIEPLVETKVVITEEPKVKAPKMAAKPKKSQPKKPTKKVVNA